jgi:hypothetical protein
MARDNSLQSDFFAANLNSTHYSSTPDSIQAFDPNIFLLSSTTPIPFATTEGSTSYSLYDTIRWGQDGLAILTSGNLNLLRGPVVVPGLLTASTAAPPNLDLRHHSYPRLRKSHTHAHGS